MSQKPQSAKGNRREKTSEPERTVRDFADESAAPAPKGPVKKTAEPSKEALDKTLQSLQNQIDEAKKNLKELDTQIEGSKTSRGEGKSTFDKEITTLRQLTADFQERTKLSQELREALKATEENMNKILEKLKTQPRHSSEDEIEKKIKRLENDITVNTLTLNEEKKILAEISALRASKKDIREFHITQERLTQERDNARTQRNQLRDKLNALNAEITEIKAKRTAQKALVDDVSGKFKTEGGKIPAFLKEKDALRATIKKCYEDMQAARDAHFTQLKEFREYERYQRDVQREKRQREYEARNQERLERALQQLESEADIEPFYEEKMICQTLIKYIEGRMPKAAPEPKAAPRTSTVAPLGPGFVPFQRKQSEHDAAWFGGAKKKKPASPKPAADKPAAEKPAAAAPAEKKEVPFTITLDVLNMFSKLNLETPTQQSQLTDSLATIRAKHAEYVARSGEEKARVAAEVQKRKEDLIAQAAAYKAEREAGKGAQKGAEGAAEAEGESSSEAAAPAQESAAPEVAAESA
eukprot:TRINITY_DN2162_c0_g1_i2.p1 TRINITY_DN2162_c0_g1~~TRINITY_DN2162_c0_g1_i2.p1  ORF type:complete len:527 (+),score=156.53 TRINITY_DN2162_c0_g1_i2:60-1640(+)